TAVLARLNDSLDREIALRGDWRTNANRLIRHYYVQCITVGLGIDGNRAYAHLASRCDDAAGDLAPVSNQDLIEHGGQACAVENGLRAVPAAIVIPERHGRRSLQRYVSMLSPRVLQFLVPQHRERAANSSASLPRHDHVVNVSTMPGDKRIGKL